MARPARLVITDDEPDLADALGEYFADLGYLVTVTRTAWELESRLAREPADLVLLDLDLPGRGGLDLLQDGAIPRDVAVIVLTGSPDRIDRLLGLELGADDYVAKPVDPRELAARVGAVLGRRQGRWRSLVTFETVSVDLAAARVLHHGGSCTRLSAGEVALVRAFAENPGRVLTREMLLEQAPGEDEDAFARAIDSRVARLRRKLGTTRIRTVRGHGYVYEPNRAG
ncbi:response regulator transcription factor [Xanthobacter sp. V4C-4]|uniref:response regulator transcription factor n=1 Tax=Xanthobacter cornucopiae TaxID=3119924 RepID=UPI0037264C9E